MSTKTIDGVPFEEVQVVLPLPLHTALAVGTVLAQAWPDSRIGADGGDRVMTFLIPTGVAPGPVDVPEAGEPDDGTLLTRFSPEDIRLGGEPMRQVAEILYPLIEAVFEQFPDAANYVEQQVVDPSGASFVIIAARSAGQTPAALRRQAEAAAQSARAAHDGLLGLVEGCLSEADAGVDPADVLDRLRRLVEQHPRLA